MQHKNESGTGKKNLAKKLQLPKKVKNLRTTTAKRKTDTFGPKRMNLLNKVHIRRRVLDTATVLKWSLVCPYIIMIFIFQRISEYLLDFF